MSRVAQAEKQNRGSVDQSDGLRRMALYNSFLQRRKITRFFGRGSISVPDIAQSPIALPTLRPADTDEYTLVRVSSGASVSHSGVLAKSNPRRPIPSSNDSPQQPSHDRQHHSSPNQKDKLPSGAFLCLSFYNRYSKVAMWVTVRRNKT